MRSAVALLAFLAACERAPSPPPGNQAGQAETPAVLAAPANELEPVPDSHPWSPSGYALSGTAPAWGGTVAGTSVRYMVPEDQFGRVIETRVTNGARSETYSGSLRGRPFVLTLTAGPCSDGVSDHAYAFTAQLEVDGQTRRGCADPE